MQPEMPVDNATADDGGGELPGARDVALAVFLCSLSLLGAAGNCLTILAVFTDRHLRSQSSSFLIVNLAASDMVVFVVIEPFLAFGTATNTWPFSTPFCAALGVLVYHHMVLSVCSMAVIAVNRYYSVVRRTSYHRVFTLRRTFLMCLAIWLLASALLVPLIARPFYASYSTYYGICIVTSQDVNLGKVTITLIAVNIVVSIAVSSLCYLKIYREVRDSRRRLVPRVGPPSAGAAPAHSPPPADRPMPAVNNGAPARMAVLRQQISRADVAISLNLFVVFAVFCACWTPLAVLILVQTSIGASVRESGLISGSVWQTAYKLVLFNSTLNIFIYAWKNRNFRSAYIRLLRFKRST